MPHRVAIDVGGTFTDLCALDEETGDLLFVKDQTTPPNFADGVVRVFRRSGLKGKEVDRFIGTGSTIVINALTEMKGAKTALITTKGFRDVLEIQRSNRTDMYNFRYKKPETFVPRYLRFEIDERVDSQGRVLKPLKESDVLMVAKNLEDEKVEAIAICLFNSYANVQHEIICRNILKERLPDVPITMSHVLTREWREYERSNTAVFNAFVQPVVDRYLTNLDKELKRAGVDIMLHVMQSNGGVATLDRARETPIYEVESGPVGGVIGAAFIGEATRERNIISLDVGGTTAKTALVDDGEIRINTTYFIGRNQFSSGHPIKVPTVDIVEIGAGGGSVAWINEVGAFRVGPQSAGADPGPACYGKGGDKPTVTDGFLLTHVLNPNYFLGGEIKLDGKKAERAYRPLTEKLGMEVTEAALGAIRLASANMINALKLVSVRRGYDPRDFVMVAFGGAGPTFATSLASELGIRKVIIPRVPGVFSAWGMLLTDLRHDFVQTKVMPLTVENMSEIDTILESMQEEAFKLLKEEKINKEKVYFATFLDMRYHGQEHTVKVPLNLDRLGKRVVELVADNFHMLHEKEYTFRLYDPIEIVNIHLTALGKVMKPSLTILEEGSRNASLAVKETREVEISEKGPIKASIYERDNIPLNVMIRGPAVIEEPTSTTVLHENDKMVVDKFGSMIISIVV